MSSLEIRARQNSPNSNGTANGTSNAQTNLAVQLPDKGIHAFHASQANQANQFMQAVAGTVRLPGWEILFKGDALQSKKTFLAAHKRGMAYIGHAPCLLPHMTVEQNLDFALKRSHQTKFIDSHLHFDKRQLMDSFHLQNRKNQTTSELSPLSAHLTALARACLSQPRALILANPTSLLIGSDIIHYLRAVKQVAEQIPVYWSCADLLAVAALADTITLLDDQISSHSVFDYFNHPESNNRALWPYNLLKIESPEWSDSDFGLQFKLSNQMVQIAKKHWQQPRTDRWIIPINNISLNTHGQDSTLLSFPTTFFSQEPLNQHEQLIALKLDNQFLNTLIHKESLKLVPFKAGAKVYAQIQVGPLFTS